MKLSSCVSALLLAALGIGGCTLEPSVDGIEFKPRAPYFSSPVTIDEQAWNGEPIRVDVERGNIEIVGQPNATTISLRANTYTWAQTQEDASNVRAATVATAKLQRDADGTWRASCSIPKGDFESGLLEATQCNLRIDVPAPDGVVHDIEAIAHYGDLYLNRLASGTRTKIVASGKEIDGMALRGNVELHSHFADVEIEPMPGSTVFIGSDSDDWYYLPSLEEVEKRSERDGSARFGATVRIPRDFTSRFVSVSSVGAAVEAFDFPDLSSGGARGPVGPASASSVVVATNQGNAT